MHFCALFALNIHFIDEIDGEIPLAQQFNEMQTGLSLMFGVALVCVGALVASRDPFFSKDKASQVQALNSLISMKEAVKLSAKKIAFKALFARPWYIIAGGIIAGGGVAKTHYWGVDSKFKDHYSIEWDYTYVVLSIVISILQFVVGFWLVFRLLQWKPKKEGHRLLSAVCLTVGCLALHYVGMLGAQYAPRIVIGAHPEGLVEGEMVFEHALIFAFISSSVILLVLINYISYFSILTDFEREMAQFVQELLNKTNQAKDPGISMKEIKMLLERYQKAFNTLITSYEKSVKSKHNSSMESSIAYGISHRNSDAGYGKKMSGSLQIDSIPEKMPQINSLA